MRGRFRNARAILLMLAAAILAPVFFRPTVLLAEPVLDYLFVVDITQSMNVRDYVVRGQPVDRLTYAKLSLIEVLQDLPCGSLVGLGVFTGWQAEVLFDPIEACHHRREIDEVVRYIDWRMTWAPQSNIALGLKDALSKLGPSGHGASLVFLTDGDEAPDWDSMPPLERKARGARLRGLIVGVGDLRPSAIPLLNQWGRTTGYFQQNGEPYLSALQEAYLRRLGTNAGLGYHRLQSPGRLVQLLRSARYADARQARRDVRWAFGAAALCFLAAVYLRAPSRRMRRSSGIGAARTTLARAGA
jgi:mxaL protein